MTTKLRTWSAIVFMCLGVLHGPGQATAEMTHYVDNINACNRQRPCYEAIVDAINAAVADDIIEVFPGVYHEGTIVFDSSSNPRPRLVLRAQTKARPPVIVGDFEILGGASPGIKVVAFVIEGGFTFRGATSDAVIQNNLITGDIVANMAANFTVRRNTLLGGSIGGNFRSSLIEENLLQGGGISIGGDNPNTDTVIRRNVLRGGGIRVGGIRNLTGVIVEGNFVSGSPGDGILFFINTGACCSSPNVLRNNTSIENAGCDINEVSRLADPTPTPNIWRNNRFATKCGTATD